MSDGFYNSNIKSCPFCNGRASLIYEKHEGYIINCDNCDACSSVYEDKDECIDAWNKRYIDKIIMSLCKMIKVISITVGITSIMFCIIIAIVFKGV